MTSETNNTLYELISNDLKKKKYIDLPITCISGRNVKVMVKYSNKIHENSLEYAICTRKDNYIHDKLKLIDISMNESSSLGKYAIDNMFKLHYDDIAGRFIIGLDMMNIINDNKHHFKHMTFEQTDECIICYKLTKRKLNQCKHTLCLHCQMQMTKTECPICKRKNIYALLNIFGKYNITTKYNIYIIPLNVSNINNISLQLDTIQPIVDLDSESTILIYRNINVTHIHGIQVHINPFFTYIDNNLCVPIFHANSYHLVQIIKFDITMDTIQKLLPKQQIELFLGLLSNLRYDKNNGCFTIVPIMLYCSIVSNLQTLWINEFNNQKKRRHIQIQLSNVCSKCSLPKSTLEHSPNCLLNHDICIQCQCNYNSSSCELCDQYIQTFINHFFIIVNDDELDEVNLEFIKSTFQEWSSIKILTTKDESLFINLLRDNNINYVNKHQIFSNIKLKSNIL